MTPDTRASRQSKAAGRKAAGTQTPTASNPASAPEPRTGATGSRSDNNNNSNSDGDDDDDENDSGDGSNGYGDHGASGRPKKCGRRHGSKISRPLTKRQRCDKEKEALNPAPDCPLTLYVCGEGSRGELGLGRFFLDSPTGQDKRRRKPFDVRPPVANTQLRNTTSPVVAFAAGHRHTLALTRDNIILSWGCNDAGALGRSTDWDALGDPLNLVPPERYLNPLSSVPLPVDVSHLGDEVPRWAGLAAGAHFSCSLTTDGRVYAWGSFDREQQGSTAQEPSQPMRARPTLVPALKGIVSIAVGHNHLVAADKNHKIYTWGNGESGQLGRASAAGGDETASGWSPQEVDSLGGLVSGVSKLACGANHSLVLDRVGRLYGWGANVSGQVDPSDEADVIEKPRRLSFSSGSLRFVDVAAGSNHSLACQEDGTLSVWGHVGKKRRVLNTERFSDVSIVAAGHNHSIAIGEGGTKLYTWGDNAGFATGHDTLDAVPAPTLIVEDTLQQALGSWARWYGAGAGYRHSVFALGRRTISKPNSPGSPVSGLENPGSDARADLHSTSHTDDAGTYPEQEAQGRSSRSSRESAPSPEPSSSEISPQATASPNPPIWASSESSDLASDQGPANAVPYAISAGAASYLQHSGFEISTSFADLSERDFRLPSPIAAALERQPARRVRWYPVLTQEFEPAVSQGRLDSSDLSELSSPPSELSAEAAGLELARGQPAPPAPAAPETPEPRRSRRKVVSRKRV